MTTKKLRWGILSTARITRRIIPPIGEAGRSVVAAVASREQSRADEFAARWSIPRAFGSYDELLASPDVDVVYIPLPNTLHCEWAVKAARLGKHVLCEKPLALTVADVDTMARAADEHNVVLAEAFMYRMHPQMARLQTIVSGGMLGQVRLVRAWFSFALSDDRNIRLSPTLGGGSLWDVGSYPVSFCQAVAGSDPVEVYAQARVHTNGVENGMAAQLIYANGLVAQIDCGFDVPGRRGAEVVGSLGTATIPDPWQPDISGTNAQIRLSVGDAETIIRPTPVNPYLSEIEALERAILDGLPLTYTVAQSCGNIATIVALYRSAAEGRAVRVQP